MPWLRPGHKGRGLRRRARGPGPVGLGVLAGLLQKIIIIIIIIIIIFMSYFYFYFYFVACGRGPLIIAQEGTGFLHSTMAPALVVVLAATVFIHATK
jgi:hypothetical protein